MTRAEDVDAAIRRAKTHMTRGDQRIGTLWEDRALLAAEVVLLREAVRGLTEERDELAGRVLSPGTPEDLERELDSVRKP